MIDDKYENKMANVGYKTKKLSTKESCVAIDPNGNQHVLSGEDLHRLLSAFGVEGIKKAEEIGWRFK